MPIDRLIYKTPFHKGKQPQWQCPECGRGVLVGTKGSFFHEELKSSKDAHKHEDWDPEWIEYTYSALLHCSNPECEETVASIGTGSVDFDVAYDGETGNPYQEFYDYFRPKFFWPHLKIFSIPEKTPREIKIEIEKSFELFFASPSSSSNHIRIALEQILDYLKVNKYKIKNKKRVFIGPHERILMLPTASDDLKDLLLAIKWLGNAGSHSGNITIDDVMDAYDILEVVLFELFEKRTKTIKKLARQINKKKGPNKQKSK